MGSDYLFSLVGSRKPISETVSSNDQNQNPEDQEKRNRFRRTLLWIRKIGFDYHSLRHTHATMLIEGGAYVKNVQARLGHSDITTTLQTYVHNTDKMGEESVAFFEKFAERKTC